MDGGRGMSTTFNSAAESYARAKGPSRGTRNEHRSTIRKWERWGGGGPIEHLGATALGEVWYSEADRPEGPWVHARKIISHANQPGDAHDFYNPTQHPFLDREGGRVIYLEGSYVNTFSGNPHPTPCYEYNQIMYRLDLSDPRLRLPEGPPPRSSGSEARVAGCGLTIRLCCMLPP